MPVTIYLEAINDGIPVFAGMTSTFSDSLVSGNIPDTTYKPPIPVTIYLEAINDGIPVFTGIINFFHLNSPSKKLSCALNT